MISLAMFGLQRSLGLLCRNVSVGCSAVFSSFHTSATAMYTLQEMHWRDGPPHRRARSRCPISGHPQMRGTVLKVLVKRPRKPNSGNRRCVLLKLSSGKTATAFIPGVGHNLQEHSQVMVRGGRKQDVVGLKIKVIRGKLDCAPVKKP